MTKSFKQVINNPTFFAKASNLKLANSINSCLVRINIGLGSILHKNVRSNDYGDAGNANVIDSNSGYLTQGDRKEYSVLKSQIEI